MLVLGMFFNPLGFDLLFALVMEITGSYWITSGIFYCISFTFFILHFLLIESEIKTALVNRWKKEKGRLFRP
jgi:hypothetical protein